MARKATQPKRTADSRAEACRIIVREHPGLEAAAYIDILKEEFGMTADRNVLHNAFYSARNQIAEERQAPKAGESPDSPGAKATEQSAAEKLIRAAKELGLEEANRILKAIVE